jgi:CDP-diacylglycerol--glycerol-3-phosphate 3-phosphatidyltransferase
LAATLVFTLAAFTDLFDGILARRYQLETKAGKFIDPLADKMLTLGMLGCFAYAGYYSPWWLVLIFFREILVTFFRIGWLLEGTAAGAEKLGKIKQGFMIAAIGFALLTLHAVDYRWTQAEPILRTLMFVSLSVSFALHCFRNILCRNQAHLLKTPAFARYVAAMGVIDPACTGNLGQRDDSTDYLAYRLESVLYSAMFLFRPGAGIGPMHVWTKNIEDRGMLFG